MAMKVQILRSICGGGSVHRELARQMLLLRLAVSGRAHAAHLELSHVRMMRIQLLWWMSWRIRMHLPRLRLRE